MFKLACILFAGTLTATHLNSGMSHMPSVTTFSPKLIFNARGFSDEENYIIYQQWKNIYPIDQPITLMSQLQIFKFVTERFCNRKKPTGWMLSPEYYGCCYSTASGLPRGLKSGPPRYGRSHRHVPDMNNSA
ncbi:hypothetical protein DFJ58DRAFT_842695 [Suillus subalutaceus]|uniref:uncharacterized protein n=1 Tax=Suillus subalutaceus TaxID=48586 RepID=UPI001B879D22|nr:uncharacterized protein DFJ58DRAFT_842695 [Suillus subalutaceus]KAG1849290.1 hypothetical protein DFJ58DRAFT_842695 [Suillus subalutaceus]